MTIDDRLRHIIDEELDSSFGLLTTDEVIARIKEVFKADILEICNRPDFVPVVRELTNKQQPNTLETLVRVNGRQFAMSVDRFLLDKQLEEYFK